MQMATDDCDDPAFTELVIRAIQGAALLASISLVHIVKVDNWFGDRWFSFAGKACGALAYRNSHLRIPPFNPHRIVSELRFDVAGGFVPVNLASRLHVHRSSESNLNNSIKFQGDDIMLCWYSGNSVANQRGAIMVYYSTQKTTTGWYVGLENRVVWQIVSMVDISPLQWSAVIGGVVVGKE